MAKGYTECFLGVSPPERVQENAGALFAFAPAACQPDLGAPDADLARYGGWFMVWPVSALWVWSMVAAQLASRFSPS